MKKSGADCSPVLAERERQQPGPLKPVKTVISEEQAYMPLWGRSEKRMPMAIEACLLGASDPRAAEQVVTENVSPRGARVITKQRWQSGEQLRIAVLTGEFHRDARIVYCQCGPSNSFYLGLEFRECAADWWGAAVA